MAAGASYAFSAFGTGTFVGLFNAFLYHYWYVRTIILVVAVVFTWRHADGKAIRVLGFLGLAWVVLLVAYPVIYVFGYALAGPHGP